MMRWAGAVGRETLWVAIGLCCAVMGSGCVEETSLTTPVFSGACPEGTSSDGLDCRLPSALVVGPRALFAARQGVPYEVRFEAVGGDGDHRFALEGELPEGLSLSDDGLLSGVAEVAGAFTFSINVVDGAGLQGAVELTLNVEAAPGACVPEEEICGDEQDNDCDGEVDEGCEACVPEEEICGDDQDNDCDGQIDEGCEACVPEEEVCGDGQDNDCDGQIDEGCEDIDVVLVLDDVVLEQAQPGEALFEVSYVTENLGGDDTASYRDNIFLTRPDVPNDVVEVLGSYDRAPLGSGERRRVEESFVMPDSVESGRWLVVVIIDRRNETGDVDLADNVVRVEVDYRGPDDVTCSPGPNAQCAGADLQGVNLNGENLIGADFEDGDLRRADLREANLSGASLSDANLRAATLRDAVLIGADLSGADLRGANLRGANFSGANLRGALLDGANMREANLTSADMTDASAGDTDVRDVLWLNTTCPDGTISTFNDNTCEGHLNP